MRGRKKLGGAVGAATKAPGGVQGVRDVYSSERRTSNVELPTPSLRSTLEVLRSFLLGRTSVFGRVYWLGMREQLLPAPVASESFQAHEGFISGLAPELAGALEPHLILAARRFHRSTA